MIKRITIIDGHPDEDPARLIHGLVDAYIDGAQAGGHEVRRINVAELEFPLISSTHDWHGSYVPSDIKHAQEAIGWASHLVIFYPLWLGDMPALLKGFLEQVMRPGFAIDEAAEAQRAGLLRGRSARIVVTMGMPALVYRLYFGAHSLQSLEQNILKFVGIAPVAHNLYGTVEGEPLRRAEWIEEMEMLGGEGR
ncbi:NAD(P)H-dependent oxidoreductase [Sphingomonas sp. MMS24-J13]|uniref:NAD(P)H-dependent oxidoreductase n=1 Tax=Sphingomonas sp. MMS24-J13 TaxID=3238686 RepID=UPI00384BF5CF